MAFVSGLAVFPSAVSSTITKSSFVSYRPSAAVSARRPVAAIRMGVDGENKKIPQGFTLFSEQLNGRAAMFGFVLALATEIINPGHPGIVAQVSSLVEVIKNI
jgi:hypothetical protein